MREPGAVSTWVAAAAAEGLALVHSSKCKTGFRHVSQNLDNDAPSKPFQLRVIIGGATIHVGYFLTADEAALAYARRVGPQASAIEARWEYSMTAEQALATAEAEGLHLRTASNITGYAHVSLESRRSAGRPYRLQIRRGKRNATIYHLSGTFGTAEEAALEVARYYARGDGGGGASETDTLSRCRRAHVVN